MKKTLRLITKAVLLFEVIGFCHAAVATQSTRAKGQQTMNASDQQTVMQALEKFSELNDLQALESAANYVNAIQPKAEVTQKVELQKFHHQKLNLWIDVLNAIDKKTDPKFDAKDVPIMNAMPPEGAQIPAGAAPDSIKDSALRQQYIESIKLNQEKTARYNFQYKLIKLNKQITDDAHKYISKSHVKDTTAKAQYIKTVEQTAADAQRKSALLDLAKTP